MRVQVKTGSEWHTTERRSAMVFVNKEPIYKALKPLRQDWEQIGNKGTHGKWCIAEYDLPDGAEIEFRASANGKKDIVYSFVANEGVSVDVDGYLYSGVLCGWILSIV